MFFLSSRKRHTRCALVTGVQTCALPILAYTVNPDVPASTFNAHKTLHQGVEALLELRLAEGLRFRQIYNYSDFRFRNDSQYGDNRLPVVPRHQLRSELRLDAGGFSVTPSVERSEAHTSELQSLM